MSRVAEAMANRAEACFRAIQQAMNEQRRIGEDGIYADRRDVQDKLRRIKAKAIEAEVLLRSLDRPQLAAAEFAGVAQLPERRGASHPEVAGSNPAPRSTTGREVKR